jgi:small-conductance mechanosensitive channel
MKKNGFIVLLAVLGLMGPSAGAFLMAQDAPDSAVIHVETVISPQDTIQADSAASNGRRLLQPISNLKETSIYQSLSAKKLVWSVIILIIAFFAIRLLIRLLILFSEKSTRYRITIKGLIPLIRVIAWSTVILFIITAIFKPSIAALITFSASVGVAIGFASQDILKNIFGGIVIIFDQPFKVGDKIEVGKYYGEVTEIGLRSTRLVTPDDSVVAVPNSEIMNQSVSNANAGALNCQVVAEIFLPLDIDTVKVRQMAIETAQTSKYIYLKKPITVLFFQEIKEKRTFYKMRLKAYVLDIRYEFVFKSEITELVVRQLLKEGILSPEF